MANLVLHIAQAALQAVAARAISNAFADDIEGPRTPAIHVLSSTEGAPIPIVFGRSRIAGQIIWAARFTESSVSSSASGGKGGGPKQTDYRYAASFAIGLADGVIDGIGRVWADGRLLDLSAVTYRLYHGSDDQDRDPLIEVVEGAGAPPAFRGVAYIVFEDMPLDAFGNRIPQLSFEVFRAPRLKSGERRLEDLVRGVTLIPASGEFVYATTPVVADLGYGREQSENLLNSRGHPNIEVALDDLQARLPNCRSVMLVISWFGDDLRCGECSVRPGVETTDKVTKPHEWSVNGDDRSAAYVVSTTEGRPTYGGTPADVSVLEAIAAIKARGLSVGLYPFILMDVPSGSGLADPYGAAEQAAFPWRGRITCHPAPGEDGSPDKTAAATAQVAAFFGACAPSHFTASGTTVSYSGPSEWSFRRMVLHYARLATMAGGVDTFLIGSELRGLTQIRDSATSFPAVAALKTLAADVRSIVGSGPALSYSADWSEYFGHQPQDGSGDVLFHLDPLWADPVIDFVGIDWYAPLSDWREGASHLDAQVSSSIHDTEYLAANIEGGEGFDWYYASPADRAAQERTPITDGLGKPWVFRYKDLRSWWNEAHYDRPGGAEVGSPTAWTPQGKPIWFIEAGCPAVDKGSNQPNVFVDPKSSESAFPYWSTGARDDLIQRRSIEALLDYWGPVSGNNPTSSVYGEPMIASENIHLWTWDARPFPDFPARTEIWSDGANWRLGHWLNGRVGLAPLAAVIEDIAERVGETVDASHVDGLVAGYVIDRPMAARAALEPLARAYGFEPTDHDGVLGFASRARALSHVIDLDAVVLDDQARRIERLREDAGSEPVEARMRFIDETRDYRTSTVSARQLDAVSRPVIEVAAPLTLDQHEASAMARAWLADVEAGADAAIVRLPPSLSEIETGDLVRLGDDLRLYRVERIDDGVFREARVRAVSAASMSGLRGPEAGTAAPIVSAPATPYGAVLDLPLLPGEVQRGGPRVVVTADPWPGAVSVFAGGDIGALKARATAIRPATIGVLLWDLYLGPIGRWDDGNVVQIQLTGGDTSSASKMDVLNGANAIVVEGAAGEWEVVQYRDAVLVAPDTYEIRGLLRGLAGSEPGQGAPTLAGARIVALNGASVAAPLEVHERGAELEWRFAPSGRGPSDPSTGAVAADYSGRDLRPLSPVHLAVRRIGADILFSWVRRSRIGGDDWVSPDIPLGEDSQAYVFELFDGESVVLSRDLATAVTTLTAGEESALFMDAPRYQFDVRVTQLSTAFGPGTPRRAWVYV